jgi:hypothetical protein
MRQLVRRDLTILAAGSAAAFVALALVLLMAVDVLPEIGTSIVLVLIGIAVWLVCISAWLLGPPEYARDRYLVLVPVFLVTAPTAVALYQLGGALFAVAVSSAAGFGAAVAAGFALSSRRR